MSLRSFSVGCAGILLLLGCWAAFGAVRSLRKRRWRGIFPALLALCLFAIAAAPMSYLAGVGAPHAVHNKSAPVSDSAITYYEWGFGGAALVGNPRAQIFAVRARTGAIVWQQTLPSNFAYVHAEGDTLYGVSRDDSAGSGRLGTVAFALDGATGATRWRQVVGGNPTIQGPILVGDTLLVGAVRYGDPSAPTATPTYITPTPYGVVTQTTEIVALRASDGQQLWRVSLGSRSTSSNYLPIIGDANVFYDVPNESTVEARSLSDGHLLWANTQINQGSLLAGSDPVFTLSTFGSVKALSATDGSTRWSFGDQDSFESAALSGGTLFVAAQPAFNSASNTGNPRMVYALDAATGAVRWSFSTHSTAALSLLVSGDTLYVAGGGVYALRTGDGKALWHAGSADGWSLTPNVDSALYVTHTATLPPTAIISFAPEKQQVYLSAIDTRDGSLCWSVPVGPVFSYMGHWFT